MNPEPWASLSVSRLGVFEVILQLGLITYFISMKLVAFDR